MNILLTTETYLPYITGVSISTDNIAKYMANNGHKVTLVCPKPTIKGNVVKHKNIDVIHIPSLPFSFYNNNATALFLPALFKIRKIISDKKIDIIHIQEPGIVGICTLIIAKKLGIPVVGALHFIPEQIDRVLWGSFEPVLTPTLNHIIKPIYNNYDQIMTPSNYFANYLKKIGVTKNINVISNGIDINLYKTTKKKPDSKNVTFFFLGRLDRDKNVETMIRSIPDTYKNVKFLIVGKGTESEFLKNLAAKLKVDKKIEWIDYVSNEEMLKLYKMVDVFCIMSPYEGQSIVTLQAAAVGLPIIAADAGALPELIQDNKNGYLIKTYDHTSLSQKINALAKSKQLRIKFGKKSREIALFHDRNEALLKLETIYKKLLHLTPRNS